VDSVTSLLRELPVQSVRLIAFNLDQRTIIFRRDGFEAGQNDELTEALRQLELGLLDYKAMRERPEPMDLLLGLVQAELGDPLPPDALIVIGPRTRLHDDVRPDAMGKYSAVSSKIFDLQFQVSRPTPPGRGPMSGSGVGDASARREPPMSTSPDLQGTLTPAEDTIERLVSRLKGQTIPIRSPHDLAGAIQRMDQRIPKTPKVSRPVPQGGDDYLLPKVARQRFIGREGAEGAAQREPVWSVSFSAGATGVGERLPIGLVYSEALVHGRKCGLVMYATAPLRERFGDTLGNC
jgi:hypothetical protein